jgi:hypothetical protein
LVPSLIVIVPFAKIPRVRREVLVFNGTVPVPIAGAGAEAAEEDEPDVADELELPDDDEEVLELLCDEVVLLEPPLMESSALCTADVS